MWSVDAPYIPESDKIAALAIPYTRGRGLDVGCGTRKVWPHVIGFDSGKAFGNGTVSNIEGQGDDLSMFSDGSLDFVYSSHLLEHFHEKDVPKILNEWARVIKRGGYLVLYVPSANYYPKVGEYGANPDHKWNIYPGDIEKKLLELTRCGWEQVECEERFDSNEYSLFEVYRKRGNGEFARNVWERNPQGKKRCLVIRYGAIGDQIMVSSILPQLQKQGYHVTYNTTPDAQSILRHDPNIDEWMIQDKDQVPNMQLGPYWEEISRRYDKVINLCESIEGQYLTLPGRLQHTYPDDVRRRLFNKNYLEHTHDIAGVPYVFAPKFYSTPEEFTHATNLRKSFDGPIVVWAINGSSPHKVYPFTQVVVAWLLEKTPAHIFLYADPGIGKDLQVGILQVLKESGADMSRVHGVAGDWKIRDSLTFAKLADVVVGPETGPLNAVSHEQNAKVIYLSHSSKENLTKHWVNTTTIAPDQAQVPCFPCHRLHSDFTHCNKVVETAAALCASSIKPEALFKVISEQLVKAERKKKMKGAA